MRLGEHHEAGNAAGPRELVPRGFTEWMETKIANQLIKKLVQLG